ncbi:MAG: hypothetical protein ACXABF_13015, partial [Candidatus Thorarchaeota archaeon]
MPNIYDVGDSIRLDALFTVTGVAIDPTIVELDLQDPRGNDFAYSLAGGTVSQETTGKFFRDVFVGSPGQWWYRYFGSG